ncbi:cation:proton antiporter [Synechococcus sp. UW140]|uniref:cation:proton antiporter n=1 Tax=Synechococcus sp. UW140 TaxID=368503 RepID=UPI0025F768DA|nr:cation:proton antiporter [Synechococcus sp. UW140]MCX5928913.1 cation:proton antiporter [Synechococcus sp. LacPavin_0920_WC12_MAG_50_7]
MSEDRLGLLWGVTIASGASAQLIARLTSLPGVVLLLASGLIVGRAGFHWIEPLDLGSGLGTVVGLLVSLVLFDGGLNLRLPGGELKNAVLRIVLVRFVVALIGGLLAAHWLAGLNWPLAAVFSATVLATGPTVVNPLVQQMRLRAPLGELLEAEGLVLEPIGAVLALMLLELVLGDLQSWQGVAQGLVLRLGFGLLVGALSGLFLSEILRRLPNETDVLGLRLQLSLGVLLLMFTSCEAFLPESGLPAAVAAGVVVGRRPSTAPEQLDGLIRQLAQLAITLLFPLLAADVSWQELSPLGLGGVGCVLVLMLLVRPLAISVATFGLPLDGAQRLLITWLAPRGIVTAAIASLFAIRLEQAGISGAGRLQGLVFLTILMTVGLQGLSAPWLAKKLGLVELEPATLQAEAIVATTVE